MCGFDNYKSTQYQASKLRDSSGCWYLRALAHELGLTGLESAWYRLKALASIVDVTGHMTSKVFASDGK